MSTSLSRRAAALALAFSFAGCHLLLEGDEITFEQGGRGGGGQGTGGGGLSGGGGQGTGLGSAGGAGGDGGTGGMGTTISVGGGGEGGAVQGPPCITEILAVDTPESCSVPPNSEQLFQFNQLCPHGDWCFSWPGSPGFDEVSLEQEDGALSLASEPVPGNGWWSDPSRDFAPYLYRRVPGNFSVVTRVSVNGFNNPNVPNTSDFKVAGLIFRQGSGIPTYDGAQEHFVKLEYGWLGSSQLAKAPGGGFGVLLGQHDEPMYGGTAAHLALLDTDTTNVPSVGLGACRLSAEIHYFADIGGGWQELAVDIASPQELNNFDPDIAVGLMTASFSTNGGTTVGAFDYAGYRTGSAMASNCTQEMMELDALLDAGRD